MYESELNNIVETSESVPTEVLQRLAEFRDQISARTILPWGEHCTECNWPTCYTTCELYSPRMDGDCRLFVEGMVRVDADGGANPYLLKIRFKRWGKLWTVGNARLLTPAEAAKRERSNIVIGAVARSLPLPAVVKVPVLRKVRYLRKREAEEARARNGRPDCFMVECYNPNDRTIDLTITITGRNATQPQSFQSKVRVVPGFTRERIPVLDIARCVDMGRRFDVEIVPNDCDNTVLYFGLLDFIRERMPQLPVTAHAATSAGKKWKCIVWDLDNTLWDGVLLEDGPDGIRLRHDVVDVIKETDRRGILHSIASRNNHDDAMKVLRASGIDEYFLCPQINWEPKSQSIVRIAQQLNIGVEAIVFVDDQPFEREEVKSAVGLAEVVDSADCANILRRPECELPVTEESRRRRSMYRDQQNREKAQQSSDADYGEFLKQCDIRLTVAPLGDDNVERVYELAQRTNQMNLSGNRYPRGRLKEIMASPVQDAYVISCEDKFGGYGIVGFAVVDTTEPRLLDLMFSCRIQGKRIEHAVIGTLLKKFVGEAERDMTANCRPTPRNAACSKVFEEMGFEKRGEANGVVSLAFSKNRTIPDDGILTIEMRDR